MPADSTTSSTIAHREIANPQAYIPPSSVMNRIITRTTNTAGRPIVTMPEAAFAKLLEVAMGAGFDEKTYLNLHQDVKKGVEDQAIPSGLKHFAQHGYFEGRGGLRFAVDADWYLATYPDVAQAIDNEQVIDAQDHFMLFGYAEGRLPSEAFQQSVAEWHNLAQVAEQQKIKLDFTAKSKKEKSADRPVQP